MTANKNNEGNNDDLARKIVVYFLAKCSWKINEREKYEDEIFYEGF